VRARRAILYSIEHQFYLNSDQCRHCHSGLGTEAGSRYWQAVKTRRFRILGSLPPAPVLRLHSLHSAPSPAAPEPVVPMDHQPFVTSPDAGAIHMAATGMDNRGECAAALPLFEQVLVLAQTARTTAPTPQTILDVVFVMQSVGLVKKELGDLSGAQAVLQQAVALAEPPPVGPNHPRLAEVLRELGGVLQQRGRYDEADATLQRALTMQEQLLGPEHEDISATLTAMGESCLAQGNYRRAKGLLKRAVAIAELHVVPDRYPDKLCVALNAMSQVYSGLQDYVMAQDMAERLLALTEQFLGLHHTQVGAALTRVAMSLAGQGKFGEAQPMLERSLAIAERVYGPHHPNVAAGLCNLGMLHLEQGDHGRAKPLFERALAIEEHAYGLQHLNVGHTLGCLGRCCHASGDVAQAKTLYERALAIFQTQLGRTHPITAEILQYLANLASESGQSRQAAALTERAAVVAVAATHQPCGWCGKMDVHAAKKCGRCQAVWYCNEECQRQAWPQHKKHCHKKPTAPVAAPDAVSAAAK
jgi:tetratricopeptide (TPR) repeat protein